MRKASRTMAWLILGALLGARPSWSQPPVFEVKDCPEDAEKGLQAEGQKALAKVASCLKALNPALAAKISDGVGRKKIRLACGQAQGSEGGRTEHNRDGSADVIAPAGAPGALDAWDARIFHELIHASDPKGALIISEAEHKRGAADVVYGCHFACYRQFSQHEAGRMWRYEEDYGIKIPQYQGFSCESIPAQLQWKCEALRQYAALCQNGKLFTTKDAARSIREKNLPTCLVEKLLNSCQTGPCKKLRAEVEQATKKNGGTMPSATYYRLTGLGKSLASAKDPSELETEEAKSFYATAKSKGYYASCLK